MATCKGARTSTGSPKREKTRLPFHKKVILTSHLGLNTFPEKAREGKMTKVTSEGGAKEAEGLKHIECACARKQVVGKPATSHATR